MIQFDEHIFQMGGSTNYIEKDFMEGKECFHYTHAIKKSSFLPGLPPTVVAVRKDPDSLRPSGS